MKTTTLVAALAMAFMVQAQAESSFVIKDIKVEGLQRTEPGTVFSYLPVKVGDTFDSQKAADAIKALFATGFFNDVRVEHEGDVVIVAVAERPVVAQLTVEGAKEFDKEQLKKALKENGLADGRIFDQALLDQAVQELKRQYYSRGKYSVEIQPTVTRLDRNRVAVTLDITEGVTAKIRDIKIVGAQDFSQDDLLEEFSLAPSGWTSWLARDDQYSKQKLSADLEKLKAFYQNQGYVEFNIESTQVSISADKKDVYLTINVTEGKPFRVSETRLAGDLKVAEAELKPLIAIKDGALFEREKVNETVSAIADKLGAEGYAFANVNVVPELDKEKQTVKLTFFVDPGRKTYVRRVSIAGNTRTRDEVIRRELRQLEASTYSGEAIKRSKERLELLGYFETVNIETPPVTETPDQVDMAISVKERATGSIQAGVGFVQGEGLQLSASVSQSNVLGSGKSIALAFSNGKANKQASVSFTDPYFTADGVSLGYDAYYRVYDPDAVDQSRYKSTTVGGGLRMGVPITEYDRVNLGLGVENTDLTLFPESPDRYKDFVDEYGPKNTTLLGSASWGRDTRDSALWPTRGGTMGLRLEAGLPGGDIQYWRFTPSVTWFFPLSKTFTLATSGEAGIVKGYGRTKDVPFFQNFYMGGIGSVRGFDNGSMGPKETDQFGDEDYLGGTHKLQTSIELLFPFPGMKDNRSLRTSLFFDAGTLWDPKVAGSDMSGELRYSAGAALAWLSPVGPMKFSYAVPLKKEESDKIQRFQFTLGTVF
ncbi:outer membrane protein assembly factor BamA [Rhodobacteraceae bacterium CH30]|nr:outer membrane protein assembly factor BamA [Rhodobacteraceae bacterium CH30]